MLNKLAIQSIVAGAVFGLALAFSIGPAFGGDTKGCDPNKQECDLLCHNIGGPRDLGANCDGTGVCTFITDTLGLFTVPEDWFLGIIIGVQPGSPAEDAHIAHGDGFTFLTFDPPLHLASVIGPHRASNVECFALRADTTQPPEPGN